MKYFGKKSLSSFLSGLFNVSWYAVIVISVISFIAGIIIIFFTAPFEQFISINFSCVKADFNDKDWQEFKNIPLILRCIIIPYFTALAILTLKVIKKSQLLFTNFKNNIVFNKSNVQLISKIGKILIALSILTFNINSLFVSILILMLCEIFKNGTALQEEHDLTI